MTSWSVFTSSASSSSFSSVYSEPPRSACAGAEVRGVATRDAAAIAGDGMDASAGAASDALAFAAATGGKLAVPNIMAASVPVPRGFRSAVDKSNPWHEYWLESIYVEISGLLALAVWTVMRRRDVPPGANVMRCHYVFVHALFYRIFLDPAPNRSTSGK